MTERDAFETRFHGAVRGYVGRVSSDLDPVALATRIATAEPRRRGLTTALRRGAFAVPRAAWVVLAAGALLAALVGGTLFVGSQQDERLPAVLPPLVPTLECPAGHDPELPGPADQAKPSGLRAPVAFDRLAGRLVAVSDEPAAIWTFDVCANTWHRSDLALPYVPRWITYDPRLGVTLMIADRMMRYHAGADTLSIGRPPPETLGERARSAYRGTTGELFVLEPDTTRLWTYDPGADTWRELAQRGDVPDPEHSRWLLAYDPGVDRFVLYLRRHLTAETYELDPVTATWTRRLIGTAALTFGMGDLATEGEIAFDEATGRTAVSSSGEIIEYDATEHAWHRFKNAGFDNPMIDRIGASLAFDTVNERLLFVGGRLLDATADVVALDPAEERWLVLVPRTSAPGGSGGIEPQQGRAEVR